MCKTLQPFYFNTFLRGNEEQFEELRKRMLERTLEIEKDKQAHPDMKDRKINTNKLKVNKFVYLTVFFLFLVFFITLGYRCLADYKVKDVLFSDFINNRNKPQESEIKSNEGSNLKHR